MTKDLVKEVSQLANALFNTADAGGYGINVGIDYYNNGFGITLDYWDIDGKCWTSGTEYKYGHLSSFNENLDVALQDLLDILKESIIEDIIR